MKEATGEGSMTIITIVIIVALAAAAAIVVKIMADNAQSKANETSGIKADVCPEGTTWNEGDKKCK